jgi:hypothetical protein
MEVGTIVKIKRTLGLSLPAGKFKILEIKDDLYRIGISDNYGSIWLPREYFD